MKTDTLYKVFAENGEVFVPMISGILSSLKPYEYEFASIEGLDNLLRNNPKKGMRIYWQEIIMRAHFCAISSMLRGMRWIDGILISYENQNYLTFCASMRGLLEAAADSLLTILH